MELTFDQSESNIIELKIQTQISDIRLVGFDGCTHFDQCLRESICSEKSFIMSGPWSPKIIYNVGPIVAKLEVFTCSVKEYKYRHVYIPLLVIAKYIYKDNFSFE